MIFLLKLSQYRGDKLAISIYAEHGAILGGFHNAKTITFLGYKLKVAISCLITTSFSSIFLIKTTRFVEHAACNVSRRVMSINIIYPT